MAPKAKKDEALRTMDPRKIMFNENNPRSEIGDVSDIVASIKSRVTRGLPALIQDITIRPFNTGHKVVAGSRRLAASLEAGVDEIGIRIEEMDDEDANEVALMENIIRKDMSVLDEIMAVAKMANTGVDRSEIAARFGRPVRWVASRAKLAHAGEEILGLIGSGALPIGHAEELMRLQNGDQRLGLAQNMRYQSLSSLREAIDELFRDLNEAPWVKVPCGVLDCTGCSSRSDKQCDMFGKSEGPALCLDSECWDEKLEEWKTEKTAELRKLGYLPVEAGRHYYATNGIGGYCDSERDADDIEELKSANVLPRFIVNDDGTVDEFYNRDDMPEKTVKTASGDDAAVEDDMDDDHLPDATEMDGETNAEGEAPEDEEPSQPSEWQLQRLARQKAEQVRDYAKRTICEEYREDGRVIDWEKLLPFLAELVRVNTCGNAINKFASEKDNARTERGEPELETLVNMHPADIMDALLETLFEEMDVTKEIPALVKACGLDYDSCVGMVEHEQKNAEVEA